MFGFGKKKKDVLMEKRRQQAHKGLDANKLMHEYEKEVFGWWGGDKEKADAMTAEEIQEKWEAHQKRMGALGFHPK